tara:strand:+ start:1588 stop:2424 length:837 start_codon:yes stop_codon:yes gene_type:complete
MYAAAQNPEVCLSAFYGCDPQVRVMTDEQKLQLLLNTINSLPDSSHFKAQLRFLFLCIKHRDLNEVKDELIRQFFTACRLDPNTAFRDSGADNRSKLWDIYTKNLRSMSLMSLISLSQLETITPFIFIYAIDSWYKPWSWNSNDLQRSNIIYRRADSELPPAGSYRRIQRNFDNQTLTRDYSNCDFRGSSFNKTCFFDNTDYYYISDDVIAQIPRATLQYANMRFCNLTKAIFLSYRPEQIRSDPNYLGLDITHTSISAGNPLRYIPGIIGQNTVTLH